MELTTIINKLDALNVPHYIDEHGNLNAHCEAKEGYLHIDYYGEYKGGYPYISPALEALAKQHKGYWEWNNPASICLTS